MPKVTGKIALVTGASSGIGKAASLALVAAGFQVIGTSCAASTTFAGRSNCRRARAAPNLQRSRELTRGCSGEVDHAIAAPPGPVKGKLASLVTFGDP